MVDAGQVRTGDVEAAWFGARGEQQLVVVDDGAVAELHGAGATVDGGDGLAEVEFHIGARVPGRLMDEDTFPGLLAGQIALGEGRSFVRMVTLIADQDHPAAETLRTECLGCLRSCQSSPDDDERPMCVDHFGASSVLASLRRHLRASRTQRDGERGCTPIRSRPVAAGRGRRHAEQAPGGAARPPGVACAPSTSPAPLLTVIAAPPRPQDLPGAAEQQGEKSRAGTTTRIPGGGSSGRLSPTTHKWPGARAARSASGQDARCGGALRAGAHPGHPPGAGPSPPPGGERGVQ